MYADGTNAQITVSDGATVSSDANGVSLNTTGSTLTVSGTGTTVTGTNRDGVSVDGGDVQVNVTNDANVSGFTGIGVNADGGSQAAINIDGGHVTGTTGNGINVATTGNWTGQVNVINGSTVTGASNGVRTDAVGSTITVSGPNTTVTGTGNAGIIADRESKSTTINVTGGATVTGATGISSNANDSGSSININDGTVEGTNGNGINIATTSNWDGLVDISNGSTVTGSTNGVRTDAIGSTITVSGQGTAILGSADAGILADAESKSTTINVTDGASVTGTTGISTSSSTDTGSSINIDGSTVEGTNGNGVNIGTNSSWDGLVNISNGATVTGATNGISTDATGATITVSGQRTKVTGTNNAGILAASHSSNTTIDVTDGASVSGLYGINDNGSNNKINVTSGSTVTGTGWGILDLPSDNIHLNITGSGTVVHGDNVGIEAETWTDGSVVNITNGATVSSNTGTALNLYAFNGGQVSIDKATVTSDQGDGIALDGSTTDMTITNNALINGGDDGIDSTNSSQISIDISGQGTIVQGKHAGIAVGNNEGPGDSTIVVSDGARIYGGDTGVLIDEQSQGVSHLDLSGGANVTGGVSGISSVSNGTSVINVSDSAVSGSTNGVVLGGNNQLNVSSGSLITGDTALALNGTTFGDTVNIADSTLSGTTNLLNITGNAVNAVSITDSQASGAIISSSDAAQTINMDSTAWNGSANTTGTGDLILNISNASAWMNSADSNVSAINLSGGSSIIMDGGNINTATLTDGSASSATLAAAAAPAPATIYSTWNAAAGSAYVLTAGTATGTFNAGVTSNSSGAAGDMTGDTIVQVGDASGATFNSMQSDVGVYRYQSSTVVNADGSTSVILDNITPTPPVPPTPPTPPVPPTPPAPPTPTPPTPTPPTPKPTLSTAAQAVVDTRAAAVNLWNDEQDALNLRMDNERRTGSSDGIVNAWGSYYGGYHRQQMDMASSSFDQTNNGFMVGADKRISAAEGDWLFGASVMRGFSDVNMHDSGSVGTDIDSYGASIYASYRMNNGLFFDASIKGTHLKNDISVVSVDGGKTSGDYSTNGFGGALKGGYHMELRSFFIEPYAQVSYARYNGMDYTLKNGLRAKDDDYTSVRVEGGANIGTSIPLHSGAEVRPYLHLAAAGETENGNTMNINGVTIDDSTDGAQGVVGLGTDVKFTKNLGAWAGANYAKGQNHSESPWQLNAGVSYTW
ncbi:autotransporter outer membrane beta-barrel domain-containing protein [Lelliottia wanjuensis]|uniref:autotransporter outer membrane beta-barrel domain-containing protein n=1 Tax=Lelliottia wanjuensis TaxID=3050585 RepID=UPI00254F8C0F|nr:autotransporter outer membrane beta-barrel domain-containing protein [Lelliottia sp. V104_15]MDK9607137.1 autotransporter outer membrane beta-barrel domain-containing protein [Lelliottia sp. V104_15]